MCRLIELCSAIGITNINNEQDILQIYQLRDYLLTNHGIYVEIFYSENIDRWRFRMMNIKEKCSIGYSKFVYMEKNDALKEGVIKILEIIKNGKTEI